MLTSIFYVQAPVPHPLSASNSPNLILSPPVTLLHPSLYPDEDNAVLSSGNTLLLFLRVLLGKQAELSLLLSTYM